MDFDLRPATPADRGFIWALRQATMRPLIEPLEGWHEALQQLRRRVARRTDRRRGGRADRRADVRDRGHELHLTWVAVAPARQRAGLGTALVRVAQAEAAAAGLSLTLRAMRANPALRLYERLGFTAEAAPPAPGLPTDRIPMRWTPGRPTRP